MTAVANLAAFTGLNMCFALIPGPDMICIVSNTLTGGSRAGLAVAFGLATGCLFHVACATLGLSAYLQAAPSAFLILKWLGAMYLMLLGWNLMRAPAMPVENRLSPSLRTPFRQGVLSNLLNPKVAIFFIAILPQFVVPDLGNVGMQVLMLGAVSIVTGTAVNIATAVLAARARMIAQARNGLGARMQRGAGCMLFLVALRVALERVQ
ncbi:MAG TPA: LysE family translocator [Burkholderiaceae bacterium]